MQELYSGALLQGGKYNNHETSSDISPVHLDYQYAQG